MEFGLPAEDDSRRLGVRAWIEGHPQPSPAELASAGYVAPSWPRPWGLDADIEDQLIIADELERAGIDPTGHNPIGIGWAGPTLLAAGSMEQKERYLGPLLRGEEFWCQLFSEPGAGSDLASLTTRAVRAGEEYLIDGQKVWNTWADRADFGILLARTDPLAPKHRGISYFICPMRLPGIEVRPIREMTGRTHFFEVFFDQVRLPAASLVGEENCGWELARVTLGNERVTLSSGGVLWGMGPTTVEVIKRAGRPDDRRLRERVVRLHMSGEVLRLLGYRVLSDLLAGREPGPEVSVRKLLADRHGQLAMGLIRDIDGAAGMLSADEDWDWGFLFSPALTIGGGTAEVLRNIIGERILGLPRDP
jgi:alkylation response protein AidB-like acyl-CoA dehydrogenase